MIRQAGPNGRGMVPAARRRGSRRGSRRGAIFHYYMVYVLLTGSIMAAAGACLHAVLRSDAADSRQAWHLQSLLRLERQLRMDTGSAESIELTDGELWCRSEHDGDIRWKVRQNIILRSQTVRAEEEVPQRAADDPDAPGESADRFVFVFGTRIRFQPRDGAQLVLRIDEPSPHAPLADSTERRRSRQQTADSQPTDPATTAPGTVEPFAVEMLLFRPADQPSPDPVSPGPADSENDPSGAAP